MKRFASIPTLLALLAAAYFTCLTHHAIAQPPETNAAEWHSIPIKNVKPHLLAYWVDPNHQPMPEEYTQANDYLNLLSPIQGKQSTKSAKNNSTNVLAKPLGITIFVDDAEKVLWVRGTQNQFDQLKQIVEFLDRPIRQIDFDIKVIELDSQEAPITVNNPMLKMIFRPSSTHGNTPVSAKLESTINNLIKSGDAEIVKSAQMTIPNNLTNRYSTATSTPVIVDIKGADGKTHFLTTVSDKENPLFMEKRFSWVLTPTINNDDTITIFNTLIASAELTHKTSAKNDRLLIQNLDQQKANTTVFTIENGHSMLFTGYNSTSLGFDDQKHPIVLWITAMIKD